MRFTCHTRKSEEAVEELSRGSIAVTAIGIADTSVGTDGRQDESLCFVIRKARANPCRIIFRGILLAS